MIPQEQANGRVMYKGIQASKPQIVNSRKCETLEARPAMSVCSNGKRMEENVVLKVDVIDRVPPL